MAFKLRERVFETSLTSGTGDLTLDGATQGGRRFDSVLSASDTFFYKIVDVSGGSSPYDFEVGIGTYAGSHVLQRTAVIESSNSNNHVNFSSGLKYVFVETPAYVVQDIYDLAFGALQADENLHGLTSPSQARANLGLSFGKQSIWVPAPAMTPRTTNGAASGTAEMSTNKNMVRTLDFEASAQQEFAQFDIRMPKSWDESTVSFIPVWSHAATTTNFGVVWGLDAVAISDNETLDVAFGTAQTSSDTGGTTNRVYQGPESAGITISGSPAEGDLVQFRIHRDIANGGDTMAIDARLHGVVLLYTNNASSDT
jgi:hypothetical protein